MKYKNNAAQKECIARSRFVKMAGLVDRRAKRKPSPRKLEPHEVVAMLKARAQQKGAT